MRPPYDAVMALDLVLRDAVIVDGSGGVPITGDVGIDGDRIVAVGDVGAVRVGGREIDLQGAVLSPGFVDVHTHDDTALLAHPGLEFKLAQGCTSLVIGNCGFSAFPSGARLPLGGRGDWGGLAGFANDVAERGPACNWISLVGHNTIRAVVMGEERGEPSAAQLEIMRSHVREAMEGGACGFSSGLIYTPGRWSRTPELIELAAEVSPFGGLYATHMRNEGDRLLEAVDEAIAIASTARVALQISHHKAAGRANWGKVSESLAKVDAAVAAGIDVTLDVYPYVAGSGPMIQYFDLDNVDVELASNIRIASCPAFREYEGRMLVDIAADRGLDLVGAVRHVLTAPLGENTVCIQFVIDEADIETNLRHPRMMVGSDGIPDLRGQPHPRLFGTFPRILARYVRERHVLDLAEAVRRMTSLACDRFGLVDRGRIRVGGFADLVAFDPALITDTATFDDPKREPDGIAFVIVNGAVALENGRHTAVRSGRGLRYLG